MNEQHHCPLGMAPEDPALLDQLGFSASNLESSNTSLNAATIQSVETSTNNDNSLEGMADNFYFAVSGIILTVCALLATLGRTTFSFQKYVNYF